jgi:hypothetical protein
MGIFYHRKAGRRNLSATRCAYVVIANDNHYHLGRARWGGGNATNYHSHRRRSPTRKPQVKFKNQEGAIKDLPKPQRTYPSSKKFLDNFCELSYNC